MEKVIRVVSPSSSIRRFSKRIERAKINVESIFKFSCILGENALKEDNFLKTSRPPAGNPLERALDLNKAFADNNTLIILTSLGGAYSNQILELIDYDLIKNNPKPLIGYSDNTIILNAIHTITNVETFYGPAFLPDFGEFPTVPNYTIDFLYKSVINKEDFEIIQPSFFYENFYDWADVNEERERTKNYNVGNFLIIHEGFASGRLIGGHLSSLLSLAGTKYFPNFDGKIFFWESYNRPIPFIVRELVQLKLLGVFSKIKGMLIGQLKNCKDGEIIAFLKKIAEKYNFPIVGNIFFGHVEPKITLPIGRKCIIDTKERKIIIRRSFN